MRPGNERTKLKRRAHAKASKLRGSKGAKAPKECRDSAISKKTKRNENAMSDIAAAALSVDDLIRSNVLPAKKPKAAAAGSAKKKRKAKRAAGMKRRKGAAHKQKRKGVN